MKSVSKTKRFILMSTVAFTSILCSGRSAHAFDYQFDDGVDIRFDNTVQYSVVERASPVSSYLGGQSGAALNTNDGDDNLRSGIVSNRVDLLTKFDISDSGYGFDTTVDSFYDTVYNQNTQNQSGASYNPAEQPYNKFTSATQTQAGRNIELRNLFVYGAPTIGGIPFLVRIGRFVDLFGESLFFGGNGISYGNAPIDVERSNAVPNTQAKDLFLPTGQIQISAQLSDSFSVSAYYKFEWEKDNVDPEGSYFSTSDAYDGGGQRIYAEQVLPYINFANPGEAAYLYRGRDLKGSNTGQFGAALHYDPAGSNWDYGLYALQYNDAAPEIYVEPKAGFPTVVSGTASGSPVALNVGNYQAVYANGIQIYGASTSTTIGPLNLAGEISVRTDDDLVSSVTVLPGQTAGNNERNALYASGDVAHYQISEIYVGPKVLGLGDSSALLGEVAGENLFAITKNKGSFDASGAQHAAYGLRTLASLTYYHVVPGLDVSPNIGLGWNFMGKSPDTEAFNGTGIDRGGDITFGVSGTYLNKWTGGLSYTRYIALPNRDPYADRDFVSFNVERTF